MKQYALNTGHLYTYARAGSVEAVKNSPLFELFGAWSDIIWREVEFTADGGTIGTEWRQYTED